MVEKPDKPLIPSRVFAVGDELIPREIIEEISDHHMQIFMREPDPAEWPDEMSRLISYLPEEERLGFRVASVLRRHDAGIEPQLKAWAVTVWSDLAAEGVLSSENTQRVMDRIVDHLRRLLHEHV